MGGGVFLQDLQCSLWPTPLTRTHKRNHPRSCDFREPPPGSFHTTGGASWHLWEPEEKLRNRPDHTCHRVSGDRHPPQHSALASIHTPRPCNTSDKRATQQSTMINRQKRSLFSHRLHERWASLQQPATETWQSPPWWPPVITLRLNEKKSPQILNILEGGPL